jgi:fatty aldehyde-generating acyl-ACP reductase
MERKEMKEKKSSKKRTKAKLIPSDMSTFGFIAHPLSINDVTKKYKIADKVSPRILAGILKRRRPLIYPDIKGIKSEYDGRQALGWFVIVPLLPWQFTDLEESYVIEKIVKACKLAQKQGAKIVGLGAFTAIVGNGGRMIADNIDIAVTTGNTYTTTLAIEGTLKAAKMMEVNLKNSRVAVVGATGSIGSACAKILGPQSGEIRLIGRNEFVLDELKETLEKQANPVIYKSISEGIKEADVILTVTGASNEIIYPPDIKSGAIVCDVARPRDVSELVSRVRKDVLVIDGAIVEVPGNNVEFGLNFGPPPGMSEGCVAETIILSLEKRYENYTIGKDITESMVVEMGELAKKHGFKMAGLRRFEKLLDEKEIEKVKAAAKQ